jgi:hypothetical protein
MLHCSSLPFAFYSSSQLAEPGFENTCGVCVCVCVFAGNKTQSLAQLGKYSTTELQPQSNTCDLSDLSSIPLFHVDIL